MFREITNIPHNLNADIPEMIEQSLSHLHSNSKEQREKATLDLYKRFLQKLSRNLEHQNYPEITDLILDKSYMICEITNNYDWPKADQLKVPNLNRNANTFYNYIRTRLNLYKGKKTIKDLDKTIEHLNDFLNLLFEGGKHFENNLIYIIFEDIFNFYTQGKFFSDEAKENAKQSIESIFELFIEESNILGLSKLENIDEKQHENFFLGSLGLALKTKFEIFEKGLENVDIAPLEKLFKHVSILKDYCLLNQLSVIWLYLTVNFIKHKNNSNTEKYCKIMFDTLISANNYLNFLRGVKTHFNDVVIKHIKKLQCLLVIYYIKEDVELNQNFFDKISMSKEEVDLLKDADINNLLSIKEILKKCYNNDYVTMKFAEKIIDKYDEDSDSPNIGKELTLLINPKSVCIKKEDLEDKAYLKKVFGFRQEKMKGLLDEIKKIK